MKDVGSLIKTQYAVPVLRHTDGKELEKLARALAAGGLKVLEITLMSEAAFDVIKRLSQESDLVIGAGTVLNGEQAGKAISAGARFLVSPGLNQAVHAIATEKKTMHIPGVLSPTEIMLAQEWKIPLVKVFPVQSMGGPQYLRLLSGPFPHMQWMASGGVSVDDIHAYRQHGASCVGIGSELTKGSGEEITRRAIHCVETAREKP